MKRLAIRTLIVAIGLALWFGTQSLIGARQLPDVGATRAGLLLAKSDALLSLTEPVTEYLDGSPSAANALLVASSLVIDALGVWILAAAIFGASIRPFLGLFLLFLLRQTMQAACALPAPDGMIWHHPGWPSLLVTYGVANDFFFSGHTALAVFGALELARRGGVWRWVGAGVAVFEIATVIVLRAHYTMDVFTGGVVALLASSWALRLAPRVDGWIGGGALRPASAAKTVAFVFVGVVTACGSLSLSSSVYADSPTESADVRVLAPTAQDAPQQWRYTVREPEGDWRSVRFDDRPWQRAPAPFGSKGTPGIAPRTIWCTSDIWMRRSFDIAGELPQRIWLRVYHDEDVEVAINGVTVARVAGWTTTYDRVFLSRSARDALRIGKNVLAVHCRQVVGGQGVDVGLEGGEFRAVELATPHGSLRAVPGDAGYRLELVRDGEVYLRSPAEGLWSIATEWRDDWPDAWRHAQAQEVERLGPWLVASGRVETAGGDWIVRDAYRSEDGVFRCVRRFTWKGVETASHTTLSVRWQIPYAGAQLFLPGICYHGNPSGVATGFGQIIRYTGKPGDAAICEEHRFPMPFASLEWSQDDAVRGAALHTLPSRAPYGARSDLWWSLGAIARDGVSELTLLSGPCTANDKPSVAKAQQRKLMKYSNTWLDVPPASVIEKTFFLDAYPVEQKGSGFRRPMRASIERHGAGDLDEFPSFDEILEAKLRFADSRWHEDHESAGFRMYPHNDHYVMGWAGQSDAPGYALLVLEDSPQAIDRAQRSLDFLTQAPFNKGGFAVRYDPGKNRWSGPDPISQGQAMESFARAIGVGRKMAQVDTSKWEAFLRRACDHHAARILADDWRPKSTNEGFLVSPLARAAKLFGKERYRRAAIHAAEHYAERHLDMTEPYWGGTLDARCEDKEGAWAGFQAFLAVYELTREQRWLDRAAHAMDVTLSYTVLWDIDMPPGRLRDHAFRSRGWTVVSAQNQHLDVYGVMYTPEVWRMGEYLGRDDLKKLALVMYRSCGQLIDPLGSQGEQIQQTNFAQQGDMSDVRKLRGGYSEGWTVLWITAHFLNAAAQFTEMGVDLGR